MFIYKLTINPVCGNCGSEKKPLLKNVNPNATTGIREHSFFFIDTVEIQSLFLKGLVPCLSNLTFVDLQDCSRNW